MKVYNTQGMLMVSQAGGAGAVVGFGVSTLGNTSGTTGTVNGSLILIGGNNVTLSQSVNGASASITISAFNQSIQTQNCLDASLAGNTSGTLALLSSGTMTLAGGNNITLSQVGNAVTISAFTQTVQTQNCVDKTLAGNTSGTLALISSGTMTLAGGNNITLSQVGNAVTISAFTQTVQTQNCLNGTLAGNTSGVLALISSGTLTLAGGNNITLSQAGNAVTISAFTQTVQTQNCVDKTLAGNTSGVLALISSGTMTLAGGNNITLSQAGNAVTISAFTQTVQTQNCVDASLAGNTLGTLALVSSGTLTLAGGSNITLSQNGNAITILAGRTIKHFQNLVGASANNGTTAGTPLFFPLCADMVWPGWMTVKSVFLDLSCSHTATNASTQAHTYSVFLGIYTANGSTLSLLNSASTSFGSGGANANISSQYNGLRFLSFQSSQFSQSSLNLSDGAHYFGCMLINTAGTNFPMSWVGQNILATTQRSGSIGNSTVTASTMGWGIPYNGWYSTTTAALPGSVQVSELAKVSAAGANMPHLVFENELSQF